MAVIDKTYSNRKNYIKFIDWAKDRYFTCPNGTKLYLNRYIYYKSEDYLNSISDDKMFPILNTSCDVDYFLIKYCPFKFIQDRMLEVYNEEYVKEIVNGTSEYDLFKCPEPGKKLIIERGDLFKHKDYLYLHRKFMIDCEYKGQSIYYSKQINNWLFPYELGEWNSSCYVFGRSVKALIRKVKSWKLPAGCVVKAYGRYVGEEIIIKIK